MRRLVLSGGHVADRSQHCECGAGVVSGGRTPQMTHVSLGGSGLEARRRVNQDIADFMLTVINVDPSRVLLSPDMAVAVVGGVNELILLNLLCSFSSLLSSPAPRDSWTIRYYPILSAIMVK